MSYIDIFWSRYILLVTELPKAAQLAGPNHTYRLHCSLSFSVCGCGCILCGSQLQQLGWTPQMISEQIKEAAISETENIYGTIYGDLHEG